MEPGRYGVSIDNQPDEKRKSPYAEIEVAVADVEGLQLGFGTNPDINGIVRTEGASECIQKPFVVDLESENNTLRHVRAQVKEDGAFKLMDVPLLLKMRVSAFSSSLADCYVKSIRLGNREQEEMTADLGEGPGVLLITLSPKAATITGSVTDANGQPAANGAVALIAKDVRREPDEVTLPSDPKGTYTIKDLRPGLYTIFAFDSC